MVNRHVVKLITAYLDECAARNEAATLVGLHWFVDSRYKCIPHTEEVNNALKKRAATYVQRGPNGVVFTSSGTEREVTSEDMVRADHRYRHEFASGLAATLKKLDE